MTRTPGHAHGTRMFSMLQKSTRAIQPRERLTVDSRVWHAFQGCESSSDDGASLWEDLCSATDGGLSDGFIRVDVARLRFMQAWLGRSLQLSSGWIVEAGDCDRLKAARVAAASSNQQIRWADDLVFEHLVIEAILNTVRKALAKASDAQPSSSGLPIGFGPAQHSGWAAL